MWLNNFIYYVDSMKVIAVMYEIIYIYIYIYIYKSRVNDKIIRTSMNIVTHFEE